MFKTKLVESGYIPVGMAYGGASFFDKFRQDVYIWLKLLRFLPFPILYGMI
jgi:hypothetical protein